MRKSEMSDFSYPTFQPQEGQIAKFGSLTPHKGVASEYNVAKLLLVGFVDRAIIL